MKPTWLLVLLSLCGTLHAQEARIHRCIGENGEPTFSDQKCGSLAPLPDAVPATPATPPTGDPSLPQAPVITQTCATSPEDLRDRAVRAFSSANALSFSGLFRWDGFGQTSALAPLRDLSALISQPLISIDLESTRQYPARDRDGFRRDPRDIEDLYELVIRTVGELQRQVPYESVHRFELGEQWGCWWLLLPN